MNHSCQPPGRGIGKDMYKVTRHTFGPNRDGARESLKPNFGPVLPKWSGKQLEMS